MKNRDLFDLAAGLHSCLNLKGFKFAYACTKNLNKLKTEIKMIQGVRKIPPAYLAYDADRVKLVKEFSLLDKDGKPIFRDGNFQLDSAKNDEFKKQLEAIQELHKDAIAEFAKSEAEWNDLLDAESEITLHKVKKEHVPEEITGEQLENILDIIEEGKE
jgi:hypothetical protein